VTEDVELLTIREYLGDKFPVRIYRIYHDGSRVAHNHEFMEIALVVCGHATHTTEGQDDSLSMGDVLVVPPGRTHAYREVNNLGLVHVLFLRQAVFTNPGLLEGIPGFSELFGLEKSPHPSVPFRRLLHLPAPDLDQALSYILRIEEETCTCDPGYEALVSAFLTELAVFLSRRFWHSQPHVTNAYARVEGTVAYLQEHYAEPIELNELAKHAHMSANNLMRHFREATGYSPMQYLIRLRVLKAAELLREKHLSITEAAYASGFFDPCYFSKRFSQLMGISPRRYQGQWRRV
jgi:AraC-like DNA-binding protein/quercetin dioxygenase-like cupin family protein